MNSIVIPSNPTTAQLGALIRQLLVALGTYAVAKGWLSGPIMEALIPIVMLVGAVVWAQVRVIVEHKKKVLMAEALPDSTAQVK